ncbi:phosphotransferase [Candidatus Berkiella aquae]|uniref:Aminoglycoside phosphotransferase family protein n=1 Tax=Candidatus Berkiella aquae TaxID=295108 RepID=A0A0Q9YPM2_9GAMM|nr:aminoglycoside phosphotransferase family protein [Candidatus Berkiella aquae]MCS5711979.1 aminoglycoside phosphotransferase family protein [Candidatus Berkiella aquae]
MANIKMHENEFDIDERMVRDLLQSQFQQWSDLPLQMIKSAGTDNLIFRLGDDKCIRLPRVPGSQIQIEKEQRWLPFLAPHLPLAIPVPIGKGQPQNNYPSYWSIFHWLEGNNAINAVNLDLAQAARDLAKFINSLHRIDATSGPSTYRGLPLNTRDEEVHKALADLEGIVDTSAALKIWNICKQAPIWDKPPVWIHSDLLPANILVNNGKVTGIIDFGMMGIGDPACDLLPAWSLLDRDSRETFRTTLLIDDATWLRGKGWALSIGLIILPYYFDTNPELVAVGKRLVTEVLSA